MANVSGIECVGVIVADPEKRFKPGQKAIALVRGMGKTINGSYAEFTCFSATNVASIECDLPWEELAAIPEREKRDSSVSSEREISQDRSISQSPPGESRDPVDSRDRSDRWGQRKKRDRSQ